MPLTRALAVVALAALALLPACDQPPPPAAGPPTLGLNLAGVVDYSSEIVFTDAFKAARPWISQAQGQPWGQGGPLEVDAKGHVKSLAPGQFAEAIVWNGFENRFPTGRFTCLYDGDGDLDFGFDAKAAAGLRSRITVAVNPKDGQGSVRLLRTNPRNPVRNIRFILPGFEQTYRNQIFHPDFLKRWQGFPVFRFMDWQKTNNSEQVEWADRPTPDMFSQAVRGVAVEYLVKLCNTQNVEPWFCMPHKASDDYVRQFATLVKETLKPTLKAHVEYSNECWNGIFAQANWCQEQGRKLGLSNNDYEAQLRYYSRRSVEVFQIWEAVFGGKERLVRVLAAQSASPWTGTTIMDWQQASKSADAIAIAPYFGNRFGDPKTADRTAALSAGELIGELRADLAESRKQMQAYTAEARKRGLRLFAYEGGQHLVGYQGAENNDRLTKLFHAANRHPGMRDLYLQNLADWRDAGGELFCAFSSMALSSKWGNWGLLENTAQDPATAPKYRAVREFFGLDVPK